MRVVNRASRASVALETTILCHGVPRDAAPKLASDLASAVRENGGLPAMVGVVQGRATVGLTEDELATLLDAPRVPKINTSSLGAALHRGGHGATTVATTMELAAAAGVRVFATGGIGGVHRGYDRRPDISADLLALSRFPVAVVASGCKGLLDVTATREALETLGVPVIGYGADTFPAFYVRETDLPVDARFDDPADLARFVSAELARTGRGVLVCHPCPEDHAFTQAAFEEALREAEAKAAPATGRDATPAILAALHEVTAGRTLRTNLALALSNARLAGALAARLA